MWDTFNVPMSFDMCLYFQITWDTFNGKTFLAVLANLKYKQLLVLVGPIVLNLLQPLFYKFRIIKMKKNSV